MLSSVERVATLTHGTSAVLRPQRGMAVVVAQAVHSGAVTHKHGKAAREDRAKLSTGASMAAGPLLNYAPTTPQAAPAPGWPQLLSSLFAGEQAFSDDAEIPLEYRQNHASHPMYHSHIAERLAVSPN